MLAKLHATQSCTIPHTLTVVPEDIEGTAFMNIFLFEEVDIFSAR